jgi:hypothetical protein
MGDTAPEGMFLPPGYNSNARLNPFPEFLPP